MNLLALLIGIVLEYTATRLFHLRAPRFSQSYLPVWFRFIGQNKYLNGLVVFLIMVSSLLPVIFLDRWLLAEGYIFWHLIFAIGVLFFSFGPHDLVTDVEEYQKVLQDSAGSAESEMLLIEAALPLTEIRQHSRLEACSRTVTEGILAQGNKRFFAVIFWFLVLGPIGAMLFRLMNSMRRESYRFSQDENGSHESRSAQQAAATINSIIRQWQGIIGWIPARLTALSYALTGHFDSAMHALRNVTSNDDDDIYDRNERVMTQTGTASLQTPDALSLSDPEVAKECTTDALRLVKRSLILWTVIISILTLWGTVH